MMVIVLKVLAVVESELRLISMSPTRGTALVLFAGPPGSKRLLHHFDSGVGWNHAYCTSSGVYCETRR